MSIQIAVRLAEKDLQRLDAAIARGVFANRAVAVRFGLERLLREEREREITEAYRRAYADPKPDTDELLIGEAGLRLGTRLLGEDASSGG